jgi:UDP-glucose 4-epimerase
MLGTDAVVQVLNILASSMLAVRACRLLAYFVINVSGRCAYSRGMAGAGVYRIVFSTLTSVYGAVPRGPRNGLAMKVLSPV